MAYVNVAEWTPEHVAEWLRGLDDSILPYVQFFVDNSVNGCKLLLLSAGELNHLNVTKVSLQELILEGVDSLRQLHYNLRSDTLQALALRIGCKARSLMIQLEQDEKVSPKTVASSSTSVKDGQHHFDFAKIDSVSAQSNTKPGEQRVSLATLAGVSETLGTVKAFISWLDRYPFVNIPMYSSIRKSILALSIELSSTAQRDQFVEHPNDIIKRICVSMSKECDYIVQNLTDSLAIQTTYLDVVTVKKKTAQETLGLVIRPSTLGMHIVDKVISSSPAHRCERIQEGDEIIQVDYQTVVGWTHNNLIGLMCEYPTEILLTIRKRPAHSRTMSQVVIQKPYQLPMRRLTNNRSNGSTNQIDIDTDVGIDIDVAKDDVEPTLSTLRRLYQAVTHRQRFSNNSSSQSGGKIRQQESGDISD